MTDQSPDESTPEVPSDVAAPQEPVPSAPAARSKLPRWAWALIIGGSVLFIGFVIAVVVVVAIIIGAVNKDDCDAPGSCGQGLPPQSEETPSAESNDPGGSLITLDANATFSAPPTWGVPLDSAWEILEFDQDGINSFMDAVSGCVIVTSQRQTAFGPAAGGDRVATQAAMQEEVNALSASAVTISELDSGTVELPVDDVSSGSGRSNIEFLTSTHEQIVTGSDPRVAELLVRAMPVSGSAMSTLVLCDARTYNEGSSPFNTLIDKLTVTTGF